MASLLATGQAAAVTVDHCAIRNHTVCVDVNLHGRNLSGAHLAYADLIDANLSGANLNGADLRHANLTGANLIGAHLVGARLGRANLTAVHASRANFAHANLVGAVITGADFRRASLVYASLAGASATASDLAGANLYRSNLRGVSLSTSTLNGIRSGGISHGPVSLPSGYLFRRGYILKVLATPNFTLSSGPNAVVVNPFGASTGASSYAAQLCDATGGFCRSTVRITTAGYAFTGLTPDTTYLVKVTATGNGTTYANSATAAASQSTTSSLASISAPSLSVTPGPTSLTLNFSAVAHAFGYRAQLCDGSNANCQSAVSVSPGSYTFSGLSSGTTYTVDLASIGDGIVYGNSATEALAGTTGSLQVSPGAVIAGGNTQLADPNQMAVGPDGTVYVANYSGNDILSFAAGSSGNVSPATNIIGVATTLSQPEGLVLKGGTLYESQVNGEVNAFSDGASGNTAPSTQISGLGDATFEALDPVGNLYVSQYPSGPIDVFGPSELNGPANPSRSVPGGPYGIATDSSGNVYATTYSGQSVKVYAAGTSTLVRTISGSNTGLGYTGTVAIDSAGRIYVTSSQGPSITGTTQLSVFAPGAHGNVAPIAVLQNIGSGLGLGDVTVGPDDSVYISTNSVNSIEVFPPFFAP